MANNYINANNWSRKTLTKWWNSIKKENGNKSKERYVFFSSLKTLSTTQRILHHSSVIGLPHWRFSSVVNWNGVPSVRWAHSLAGFLLSFYFLVLIYFFSSWHGFPTVVLCGTLGTIKHGIMRGRFQGAFNAQLKSRHWRLTSNKEFFWGAISNAPKAGGEKA